MAQVNYTANLSPEEFDLFSKFLKDLKRLKEKKENPIVLSEVKKELQWRPSDYRK